MAVPNSLSNTLSFYHSPDTTTNTSVAESQQLSNVMVWPMPANSFTRVALQHPVGKGGSVQLVDVQGRVALQQPLAAGSEKLRLELDAVPTGTYVLRVTDAQGIYASQTITVQH